MAKQKWRPGNMLFPLPPVLVTVADTKGRDNIFTVAWAGTVCSDPPMVSISVRPSRFSCAMIQERGEFVINLTTEKLSFVTDFCGVRSGREFDKFQELNLHKEEASEVGVPLLAESPVNIECKVVGEENLGSHILFLAEVKAVHVDENYLDKDGKLELEKAGLLAYCHGSYFKLGKKTGSFGYSVRKKKTNFPKMKDKIAKTSFSKQKDEFIQRKRKKMK